MLNKAVQDHLNTHLNIHFTIAYFYLGLTAYFRSKVLNGFAGWSQNQAQARLMQGGTIFSHIDERNGDVNLTEVPAPPINWDSPLAAIQDAYAREQELTKRIYQAMDTAKKDGDKATVVFLSGFVQQQVHHENTLYELVQKLTFIGNAPGGIFMLDASLAGITPPQQA
ncbi:ferritin [bacterium]|nr:ferritin [bacterium]